MSATSEATDDQALEDYLAALEEHGRNFGVEDAVAPRDLGATVGDVRRRRGRLTNDAQSGYRDVALVERDGVLVWMPSENLAAATPRGQSIARRRRGARRRGLPGLDVVTEVTVPVLEPNEYIDALRRTDRKLNGDCEIGIRAVRMVQRAKGGSFVTDEVTPGPYTGKTLLIVHGTFSSSSNSLNEYASTAHGARFLSDALKAYNQVLVFDHPTLSVSPFLNALTLARTLAGSSGAIDVIAHSRGGVVVRWWLEVFGDALAKARVRAVLVGCPLHGTSLASPGRLAPLLSVVSSIGKWVGGTLKLAAAANPFTMASFALLQFVVRREKNHWGIPPVDDLGSRPGIDAAVAVIPGLQGQAAVDPNYELDGLRESPVRPNVDYFAVTADFEPERMGWKLWKVITEFSERTPDMLVDKIFPGANDLVVDTRHMTSLAKALDIAPERVLAFGQQSDVHHCSYFRSEATIAKMREWLK